MIKILLLIQVAWLTGCLVTRAQLRDSVAGETAANGAGPRQERSLARDSLVYQQEYDGQFRDLRNNIDLLSHRLDQIEQKTEGQSSLEPVTELSRRLGLLEEAMNSLERELSSVKAAAQRSAAPAPTKSQSSNSKGPFDQGESLFTQKKWREAIMAFQKYREAQPKGNRYGEATYKIGVCFQELEMKPEAKAFFEEAVAKFPGSKESRKAQYRLKNL